MQKQSSKSKSAEQILPMTLRNFDQLPDSAHVRLPVVGALWGISDATVWRKVKNGSIPKQIKLSARVSGWNVGQLRQALALFAGAKDAN